MSDLAQKRCVPCEGGIPPLGKSEVEKLLAQLDGWSLDGKWITKEFSFKNFVAAMRFVNRVAACRAKAKDTIPISTSTTTASASTSGPTPSTAFRRTT